MSIDLRPFAEISDAELAELEAEMAAFYRDPPVSYYVIADVASQQYEPGLQPFHCDLVSRVVPGMRILELGCGTAHLCPQIEARGGHYTGLDHSVSLLAENRRKFPTARFLPIESETHGHFDLVASLYTIEHVTNPPAYLERMWSLCRPGGLLGVICPEFVDSHSLPPSLFYGRTPRRFREKVRAGDFADACRHLIDLKWTAARWRTKAQRKPAGAFWMNLRPSELNGAVHGIDTDAIHFPRLSDLRWWLTKRGAKIVTSSPQMPDVPRQVAEFNCYVLAQKPSHPA